MAHAKEAALHDSLASPLLRHTQGDIETNQLSMQVTFNQFACSRRGAPAEGDQRCGARQGGGAARQPDVAAVAADAGHCHNEAFLRVVV